VHQEYFYVLKLLPDDLQSFREVIKDLVPILFQSILGYFGDFDFVEG
jgi:hypothetical protein